MPQDFLIVINNFFISSSFFINSYDSQLLLYPQYFLEYYNKIYSKNFINLISFFKFQINLTLYVNLLIIIISLYFKILMFKFINYVNLNIFSSIELNIYKINMYLYFLKYLIFYFNKCLNNVNIYILYCLFSSKYKVNKFIYFNKIKDNVNLSIISNIYNVYFSNSLIIKLN